MKILYKIKFFVQLLFLTGWIFTISCYGINHIKNQKNPDFSQSPDVLIHKMNKKLSWQDFQGQPPTGIESGIYLCTTIQMVNNVNVWWGHSNYDAYGIVFKSESWVTDDMKTDYNLQHQQTLFDISEIYAQKLETYINNNKKSLSVNRQEITGIFNRYDEELKQYQNLYESETDFGKNTLQQQIWNKKISKELDDLKEFDVSEM